jgi:hypothetical protein
MIKPEEKYFLIADTIKEIVNLSSFSKKEFIFSSKIDLPNEIRIFGSKVVFQMLLLQLIKNARQAYDRNLQNKIILITSKIENEKELSISVTNGGKGFSYNTFIFRERNNDLDINEINKIIKKNFNGYTKIFSKKNRGTTIKCFFPLN